MIRSIHLLFCFPMHVLCIKTVSHQKHPLQKFSWKRVNKNAKHLLFDSLTSSSEFGMMIYWATSDFSKEANYKQKLASFFSLPNYRILKFFGPTIACLLHFQGISAEVWLNVCERTLHFNERFSWYVYWAVSCPFKIF